MITIRRILRQIEMKSKWELKSQFLDHPNFIDSNENVKCGKQWTSSCKIIGKTILIIRAPC